MNLVDAGYRLISEKVVKPLLARESKEAEDRARVKLNEQIALSQSIAAITSSLELGEVLHKIAEQLCLVADATSVYILNLDTESNQAEVVAEYYGEQACEPELESDLGVVYEETDTRYLAAMQKGVPWVDHVDDPDLPESDRTHLTRYGAKSVLYIPMKMGSRIMGVAEVWESRQTRRFSQGEIKIFQALSQNAAIALENARLYEQTKQEISERGIVEASLRESEERYSLAALGANDGLWDWDLDDDSIYYSPRWKLMLGYNEDDIDANLQEWFQRIHPEDLVEVQLALSAHLEGVSDHFEQEYRIKHRDGTYRWVLTRGLAVRDSGGNAYRMAGSQTDITLRKKAEEKLSHDALHDLLTGLPNRALFLDRLKRVLEHGKRNNDYVFAVLFLDLDRFKNINDRFGHDVGDKLLIAIGERLRSAARASDTVARLGGDEFVILLEDIEGLDDATGVATRIMEKTREPFNIEGKEIFTSCSTGVILSEESYEKADQILRDADIAMYRAKAQGRGTYIVFEPHLRTQLMNRIWMENDLRKALRLNEFCLFYQPILSLSSGKLVGFEALLRWIHPSEGLILPGQFISLAEETRLIIPIGGWVLKEACRQLKEWEDQYLFEPPLTMSVNLSSLQLTQHEFVNHVEQIVDESGLNPASLVLEITESMIMEENQIAAKTISDLRDLGVRVHLDDFGTGYSALSYLQRYPIDILKIDRSFIAKINGNGEDVEIIKAILNLARDLNMGVIAEGIETESQFDLLKDLNCEYGQGFFFARPMDHEMVDSLLTSKFLLGDTGGQDQFLDKYMGESKLP